MNLFLEIGAHFAVIYAIFFITYLWYKSATETKPMTFLEMFLYMEDFKEEVKRDFKDKILEAIEESDLDTRKKLIDELWKVYGRTKEDLKNGKNK